MKEELKEKIQLLRPRRVSAAAAFATARGPVFGRLRPFTVLYSRSLSYQFVVFDLDTLGTGGSMCAISSTSAIMIMLGPGGGGENLPLSKRFMSSCVVMWVVVWVVWW